jgi:negative regulator of replication initiation
MQKLTLSIDDDLYAMLHSQIGRGSIGRFVSDAIRPHLNRASDDKASTAFGMLSHLAKSVSASDAAQAKRAYMAKRNAAKQIT